MCHCIDKVFQLAVATFSKKTPSESAKRYLDILIAQTNKLTGADVGLEKCSVLNSRSPRTQNESDNSNDTFLQEMSGAKAPVTYIPVSENKDVSMGIFIIREGQGIPLHDHPHMHGIIKCLKGNLKITSFTKKEVQLERLPERIRQSQQLINKVRYGELFLAEQGEQIDLSPESSSCVLGPHKSNIHRVESVGGPAAFLDILAPPYNIDPPDYAEDRQERDCHYFRILSETSENPNCKWLLLSDPPATFYCDTEPYMGPRVKSEQ